LAGEIVALVNAVREARRRRSDLAPEEFTRLFGKVTLGLPGESSAIVDEILAELNALQPPRPRTRPRGRPHLSEPDVRRELIAALDRLREGGEERPTREEIAEALGIEPITLRRRVARFPALSDLLPSSGRPRRT
ncbi:MAG TPA: hypothetical protein VNF73_02955, partial [Candidatus Saccharimonadales bacterium]|nr:hypothetical protein [Candidatus Saccharimonadales bacterium]